MSSTMVVAAVVLAIACLLAGPALIPSTGMLDELILPVLQKLPLLDGLAGSPLAKHNMPWGLNPSPTISSAAPELPSKVSFLRPAALAVLSKEGPFKRKRLEPLKSTKLAPAGAELQSQSIASGLQDSAFVAFDERFLRLIGEKPTLWRLAQRDYEFAHEGPVWLPAIGRLFVVSNRLGNTDTADQRTELWLIDPATMETEQINPDIPILVANGATNWSPHEVLVIQQGGNETGGALFALDVLTGSAKPVVDNFHGLQFNSPNDVVVSREGLVYFSDPSCGVQQHFRSDAQLGEYLWRFDPRSGAAAVAAEGFLQPNGVVLSPDGATAYVTDTGCLHPDTPDGGACSSANAPRSIYAFDVIKYRDGSTLLANRRLFAVMDVGVPDGIKVDVEGNIWTAVGDGVAAFSRGGKLLGKIFVGEVSNLVFAGDVLVMLRETEVLAVQLSTRGVVLPGMFSPAV